MAYFSKFYQIEVRNEIAKEFTDSSGRVDDMMAGLHEIRARHMEQKYDLKALAKEIERRYRGKEMTMKLYKKAKL